MVKSRKAFKKNIKKYGFFYTLFIIFAAYLILFCYWPLLTSVVMSFKNFTIRHGIWDSAWNGFKNYKDMFSDYQIIRATKNTIQISLIRMVSGFFPPIILALFIFDMKSKFFKKATQTLIFIPHFFSWIVVFGLVLALFSVRSGLVNNIIEMFSGKSYDFMMSTDWFRPILIGSAIWKEMGWGTIIYTAALMSIGNEVYEAAAIDGAGPWKRIIHVSIPGILPIISFVLIMGMANILRAGGEQILLYYNNATMPVADVLETWVIRVGLNEMQYNLGNIVGLLQGLFGFIFIIITNKITRKYFGRAMW